MEPVSFVIGLVLGAILAVVVLAAISYFYAQKKKRQVEEMVALAFGDDFLTQFGAAQAPPTPAPKFTEH